MGGVARAEADGAQAHAEVCGEAWTSCHLHPCWERSVHRYLAPTQVAENEALRVRGKLAIESQPPTPSASALLEILQAPHEAKSVV